VLPSVVIYYRILLKIRTVAVHTKTGRCSGGRCAVAVAVPCGYDADVVAVAVLLR